MSEVSQVNKRIAKNTIFLYIRLLLLMGVSFYTSRVVLQILGVEDLGIYNVVGGIVTMMSFMNSSLNITTQRFLNYEMGKGNSENLNRIFSMSFWCYSIISFIVVLIAETIGLWFFYEYLNIPTDRLNVAFWVYQFSIFTFVVNLLTVPYTSTIIANERMSVYAYVSIGDAILKLLMLYILNYMDYDKLGLYAFMMFIVTAFIGFCNWFFCRINFKESNLKFLWDKGLFYKLLSFSGWNTCGSLACSLSDQGVNILINMFFGPIYNGSRAISFQVRTAVNSFSANFLTAVRPQIFKSYAEGNLNYMNNLVYTSSKISVFLLLCLITPILLNTEYVLFLWLGEIPDKLVLFTQLVIIGIPINTLFPTLAYVSQASGKVRDYQLVASVTFVMVLISTFIVFKIKFNVYWAFIMSIIWDLIGLILRLYILKIMMSFSIHDYTKKVIVPILKVLFISVIPIAFLMSILNLQKNNFSYMCISSICVLTCMILTIWYFGLNSKEKQIIGSFINKFL